MCEWLPQMFKCLSIFISIKSSRMINLPLPSLFLRNLIPPKVLQLVNELEMPIVPILSEIELNGIAFEYVFRLPKPILI